MLVVTAAQRSEELTDIGLGDLFHPLDAARREDCDVPAEVAAIRRQRVDRQATLDGQVIEVGRDHALEVTRRAHAGASAGAVTYAGTRSRAGRPARSRAGRAPRRPDR